MPLSRPRGALPEAFESGAASALGDAGSPVEEVRGAKVDGRGSRKRRSVDAVLGRSLATVGPGSSAGRSPTRKGASTGLGGGLARPGYAGAARKRLRRWRPATDGRHRCRSARPGTKERRAGGLVRLCPRRVAFLPYPYRARPPGREHGPGLPLPSGIADALSINTPGRRGRGDKGACTKRGRARLPTSRRAFPSPLRGGAEGRTQTLGMCAGPMPG